MEVPAPDCQAKQLEEALREDLPAALPRNASTRERAQATAQNG